LAEPILDVGCGDGLFARLAYPNKQSWGIDINPSEVRRAQASSTYSTLICGSICDVSLPSQFFGSAIANCSLEHVPDIDAALRNVRGALRPGAKFVLIVPTPDWTEHLATVEALRSVGLHALAQRYADGLNSVFSHVHLDAHEVWAERLQSAGFADVQCAPIVGRAMSWTFDIFLYPSLVAYLTKKLTGRWIVAPGLRFLSADAVRNLAGKIASRVPPSAAAGEYLITCTVPL
jgi:SAM-dependent methyltransferase